MDNSQVLGDRYELVEPIGRGGMATIFRAKDRRMGRTVAVKILREMYSSDPKFVLRFQREARAVSALAHPNIVQVFDYGQSDDSYFIVMELIEGHDLRRYLRTNGILDLRRAVVIAHDVALALGAAHRRGIVHRDVKPQNILVNDEGLVKLTDFGIATFYRDIDSERLTTTGMTLGTVQYYAPEQAQGEIVSPAADVYALGIVLYEMLVGHPPFDGDTPVSIAVRHIQEPPVRPSRYNPSIPPALERVILRCLEKDPRDRYRDGDALAYALETFDRPRTPSRATPALEEGAPVGFRRGASGPINTAGRAPAGPRLGSSGPVRRKESFDDDMMIMPNPTRPDIAPGTIAGPSAKLMERPDDEPASPVAGVTTAIIIASILLLLGVGCFLTLRLTPIGQIFGGTPPPVAASTFPMPNFVGMNLRPDAVNLASSDQLQVTINYQASSTADQGKVVAQSPNAGQPVLKSQTVTITVGQGPNTIAVPDVTGQNYTDACSTIKAKGLTCVIVSPEVVDPVVQAGLVISTNPAAGQQVAPGTSVNVSVSAGPPTPQPTSTPTTAPPTATPTVAPTCTPTTVPLPATVTPIPTGSPIVPTATTKPIC